MGASGDFLRAKFSAFRQHKNVHLFCHALEDLPEDARVQAAEIASDPSGISFCRKVLDDVENAGLASYGNLERFPLLHFLSDYPVTPYTYKVSAVMSRGQHPSPDKLTDLFRRGHYRATVNLCAERDGGDRPAIEKAGLASELRGYHIPIVDMDPPAPGQVIELLDILTGPESQLTYVHCEAGKGRTGAMTACYRMAVMGWSADDALTEAKNFGCSVPMQQAFIGEFGAMLQRQDPALGQYPLKPVGSVKATSEELAASVASTARLEKGEP